MSRKGTGGRPTHYTDPDSRWEMPPALRWTDSRKAIRFRHRTVFMCDMHWQYLYWLLNHSERGYPSTNAALRHIVDRAMRKEPEFAEYMGEGKLPPYIDRGRPEG